MMLSCRGSSPWVFVPTALDQWQDNNYGGNAWRGKQLTSWQPENKERGGRVSTTVPFHCRPQKLPFSHQALPPKASSTSQQHQKLGDQPSFNTWPQGTPKLNYGPCHGGQDKAQSQGGKLQGERQASTSSHWSQGHKFCQDTEREHRASVQLAVQEASFRRHHGGGQTAGAVWTEMGPCREQGHEGSEKGVFTSCLSI